MSPYDFVHLALLALNREIQGRTKLQKTIYFLGILAGNLGELGYRAHYFGPYSDAVSAAVNRLKSLGFLQETCLHTGAFGDEGFEIARHDYELTDEGRKIAQQKAQQNPEAWTKMEEAVGLFNAAGDINYMKMSVAAKTFFMLRAKKEAASVLELTESARAFGWNPKPAEILESVSFLEKLGLASAEKA